MALCSVKQRHNFTFTFIIYCFTVVLFGFRCLLSSGNTVTRFAWLLHSEDASQKKAICDL